MLLHELPIPRNEATEILRPGTIQGTLQHRVPDLPGAQLLGIGWEPHVAVDLSFGEVLLCICGRALDEVDILPRVETDESEHRGEKRVRTRSECRNRDGFPFEVSHGANAIRGEQFETSGVHAGEEHKRDATIDVYDGRGDEPLGD